jgi:hypothetical protein
MKGQNSGSGTVGFVEWSKATCVEPAGSLFYLSTVICHFVINDHCVYKYDLLHALQLHVYSKFCVHCNTTSCSSLTLHMKEEIT